MKRLRLSAAMSAASLVVGSAYATSALADEMPMLTKSAPVVSAAATGPTSCANLYGFFLTDCQLGWYGVRFYGTVDMGGTYQTHGSPFDKNFPTGASYLLGAGGRAATNRTAGFGLGPNAHEPVERRRQNQGADCAGRLVVYFPERVCVRPVFVPPGQRAAGHAKRHRRSAEFAGPTVRLQPVGVAGGDECRRR